MKLLLKSLFAILLGIAWFPDDSGAVVIGSVEWRMGDYQREADNGSRTDLSSFYQNYTLVYRDRQLIQGGQAGNWTVGLGYEWAAVDVDADGRNYSIDSDKILYEGELTFKPPGLPFRLDAFSRDLTAISPTEVYTFGDSIIEPRIIVGLSGELHTSTGLTLLAGGDYANIFGEYRAQLAALPRLLVDYREDRVRDQGLSDNDYLARDLAFVSLNRKNNWFHYKIFEFTDYNNPDNDFTEKVWLLGTVDHLDRRRWINLTNWLAISADASLTETTGRRLEENADIYRVNLFSNAKRRNWHFSNFTSLSRRTTEDGELEKTFDFPLFAEVNIDPLHRLKLMFIESSWEDENIMTPGLVLARREDDSYARVQLESKLSEDRILTPEVEAEWLHDEMSDNSQAARLGVELRSGDYRARTRDWLIAGSAAWFDNGSAADTGPGKDNQGDSSYYEQTFEAAANYRLTPTVSIGGHQELAMGEGDFSDNRLNRMSPTMSQAFRYSNSSEEQARSLSGTSYRSTTDVYLELDSAERWRNRFSAYFDFVHVEENQHQAQLRHDLTYSRDQLLMRSLTSFLEGDGLSYRWQSSEISSLDSITGPPDLIFDHETRVDYRPNLYWMAGGTASATWGKGDRGDGWLLSVEQRAAYHLFETAGIPRKWLSFEERFTYERAWGNTSLWYAEMELGAIYYMTRALNIRADFETRHYGLTGQNEYVFEIAATAAFRKLEARLSYAYGYITNEGLLAPGFKEQLWEAGLKKTF